MKIETRTKRVDSITLADGVLVVITYEDNEPKVVTVSKDEHVLANADAEVIVRVVRLLQQRAYVPTWEVCADHGRWTSGQKTCPQCEAALVGGAIVPVSVDIDAELEGVEF